MIHKIKKLVPQELKNVYHLAKAVLANVIYGFPTKKLKVIGVTGTDGKTTTVQMITKILEEAEKKVAMASTINFRIGDKEWKNLSHYTTMSPFAVQKFAADAIKDGCEYLILETSSHALDQHRIWGVKYDTAVITNITREHLDYHGTMERYRKAKKKLFDLTRKNGGTIIVNLEMEKPEDFLNFNLKNKFAYTTNIVQSSFVDQELQIIKAEEIELGIAGSKFKIDNHEFNLNVPGKFNIENALAATCVGLSEGIEKNVIRKALQQIKGVSGRMENVPNEKGFNIIVDFALTPVALEKLYSFLATVKKPEAKIIAVFGSCGDRDKGKRPIMAEVVSKYAQKVIITNDEPYYENPEKIIEEIAAGITNKREGEDYFKITDRREAIKKALEMAEEGDIIAVTGMGAEESMVVENKKIPWNDKAVIQEELAKI